MISSGCARPASASASLIGTTRERKRPVHARRQERALRDADRGRAVGESTGAQGLLQRLRGAKRALRFVAAQFLESEHRIQPVAGEPVGDAAVQRDRLVEHALQALRQLAQFLRIEVLAAARRTRAAGAQARPQSAARDRRSRPATRPRASLPPHPRVRRPAACRAARSRRRAVSSSVRDRDSRSRDPARDRARVGARCGRAGTAAAPPCTVRRARSRPSTRGARPRAAARARAAS